MADENRGVLYPGRLPEFHRLAPPDGLAHAVRWFWIPEWDLPAGARSAQRLLPFPACNIVAEPEGLIAVGPPTRSSERVLNGRGWAVGALLRPAAAQLLVPDMVELLDASRPLDEPELHRAIAGPMSDDSMEGSARRDAAAEAFAGWVRERVPPPAPGSDAALANALTGAIDDPAITRVSELAPRFHVSIRTLQRIAVRFFGLSLHSMIRRRRLQEGAERLRRDPELPIARLASELGYADHAHFTSDFRDLLGVTPSRYRESAAEAEAGPEAQADTRSR